MNLFEMVQMQRELDQHIESLHPRQEREDRFAKKRMALLVEIGEAANEARTFKYWSLDQNPRKEKLLEEFIDVFHFILSIGIEKDYDFSGLRLRFPIVTETTAKEVIEEFEYLYYYALKMGEGDYFEELLSTFLILTAVFGFTWKEITHAYQKKNQTNHKRQEERY